jgi:hypothetical protein
MEGADSSGGPGGQFQGPGGGQFQGPGGGGSNQEPDFRYAETGAIAFLNALKAKDPERLKEATALRSVLEVKNADHKEMFQKILEGNLEDEKLNQLAELFNGMAIVDENTYKSTGSIGIIVGKNEGQEQVTRTIYMRKEKAGWKVLDFSALGRRAISRGNTRGMYGRRGRR